MASSGSEDRLPVEADEWRALKDDLPVGKAPKASAWGHYFKDPPLSQNKSGVPLGFPFQPKGGSLTPT